MVMTFPNSFASSRLNFERLRSEHAEVIHAMHQDAGHMALLGGVRTLEQTAAYMKRNLDHWTEFDFGLWLLRDATTKEIIGRALLRHFTMDGIDDVEVGYGFTPAAWGRGLATEATVACLEHGWHSLGLTSIVAITLPINIASRRVMEKAGMRFDREILHSGIPHVLYRIAAPTS